MAELTVAILVMLAVVALAGLWGRHRGLRWRRGGKEIVRDRVEASGGGAQR